MVVSLSIAGVLGLGWSLDAIFGWSIISDNTLNNVANICTVVALLVAVLAALWPILEKSYGPSSVAAADLADDLAQNLLNEWLEEADARHLRQPGVLPLAWSAADNVSAEETAIPVHPGRLDGDFDAAARRLGQTYQTIPDGRLLVLGEPGAGKTVLAIILAVGLLQHRQRGGPVPMVLSLSSWDPSRETLTDWMIEKIADIHYGGSREIPRTLLKNDLLLPILDGLDEIPEPSRAIAVSGINRSTGVTRPVVLTCRRAEFEGVVKAGGPVLRHAALVQIRNLAAADVISYLDRTEWPKGTSWKKVFSELKDKPNSPVATAFHSPLMVSAAKSAYEYGGGDPGELLSIDSRHELENTLLDRLVEAAYPTHDRPPPAGPKKEGPERQEQRWLTLLATYLYRKQERDIAWWRLSASLLPESGSILLSAFGALTPAVIVYTALARLGPAEMGKVLRGSLSLAIGFILTLLFAGSWQAGRTRLPARLSFAASRGSWKRFRRAFVVGAGVPWLFGVAIIVIYPLIVVLGDWSWSFQSEQGYFVSSSLTFGVGLVLGAGNAVLNWLTTPREDARRADPLILLRNDRTSAIVGTVVAGTVVALLAIPVFVACVIVGGGLGKLTTGWPGAETHLDLPFNLPMFDHNNPSFSTVHLTAPVVFAGLLLGLVFTVVLFVGRAWTQFVLLRVTLRIAGKLPLRLMGFLADAQRRQVLRQAGGVYQFRHVRLQERLVTRAAPSGEDGNSDHEDARSLRALAGKYAPVGVTAAVAILTVLASISAVPKDMADTVLGGCGNNSPVTHVLATKNGYTVVGTSARKICFWHRNSSHPFATASLGGHTLDAATLSSDGRTFVATAGAWVGTWETGTGKPLGELALEQSATGAALSPRGDTVVSVERESGALRLGALWDVRSRKVLASVPAAQKSSDIKFSPDGSRIAFYSAADTQATIFSIVDGPPLQMRATTVTEIAAGPGKVATGIGELAFSPDAARIATHSIDHISVWNASDGTRLETFGPDVPYESSLAFSADGRHLLGESHGTVRVWASGSPAPIATLSGAFEGAMFSPDGRTIAVPCRTDRHIESIYPDDVMLWDFAANTKVRLRLKNMLRPKLRFSGDGLFILAWRGPDTYESSPADTAELHETTTGQRVMSLIGHTGDVTDASFSTERRDILTSSVDGTVRLWHLPS